MHLKKKLKNPITKDSKRLKKKNSILIYEDTQNNCDLPNLIAN
jgi:hypothetical protein